MDIRPNHVAIYIRWSTEDQGDGTTLAVQKDGCSHYVLSQGWAVNEDLIFIDDGYSGGSMKRPAMTALRKRVQRGEVDCVVVYKLDRLSRSVLDTVNLVLEEWDDRCFVKSAREPIDTTSPSGKLFFYMLLSYAEWERSVIKERTLSGRIRRAQEGRIAGAHPYGYKLGEKPGTLEIVPEEAAIVRRIYEEYIGGKGTLPICNDLNADGIPTSRGHGKKWYRSTIRHILQNPLYKGEYRFLQQRVNPKHARNPQEPWRVKNDQPIIATAVGVPIIIEPEFWERVQARATSRHRRVVSPRSIASDHLLTGILRCRCGATMCGARPQKVPYYSCSATRDSGNSTCDCGWIKQEEVDSVVLEKVMERYGSPERRLKYFRQLTDTHDKLRDNVTAELRALEDRLKALEVEATRMNKAFRSGQLRLDLYQENRTELDAERRSLETRISEAKERLHGVQHQSSTQAELEAKFRALDQWDSLTRPQQKEVLRGLLSIVKVFRRRKDKKNLEINLVWRTDWPEAARNVRSSNPVTPHRGRSVILERGC